MTEAGVGVGSRSAVRAAALAIAVAVAFADSSIVVLALPEIYARFDTTIEGVSWVMTSYNLALALGALGLVIMVHRARAHVLLAAGVAVFATASIGCALSGSVGALIAARSVQGLGGALLLAGSLPVLGVVAGAIAPGVALWIAAGTFGAAVGPALGGVLTQVFDWRSIFVAQVPVAGAAILAVVGGIERPGLEEGWRPALRRTLPANLGLALIAGALVGTLFLGVLLVIDVFGSSPIEGAAIVSAIPAAALLARPIGRELSPVAAVAAGVLLLAAGLSALALLPSSALTYTVPAFALCGFGLGLSIPGFTQAGLGEPEGIERRATLTVGVRHLGLVLALAIVAPVLTDDLSAGVEAATLNGTAVVIDGLIPATTKIPLALDIRDVLARAPEGAVPDLTPVFERHGASTEPSVRRVRDELRAAIERAVARAFRSSFLFCALLAALALLTVPVVWRRVPR